MIGRLGGRAGGIRPGRVPVAVFCILALGAIFDPAGSARAQSPAGQPGRAAEPGRSDIDGPLVLIHWTSASLREWEECDGLPTRRFVDTCRDQGWILEVSDLRPDENKALDAWAGQGRRGVSWVGRGGEPPGSLLLGSGADGETDGPQASVALDYAGVAPRSLSNLEAETRVWLHHPQHLRWEEVVELLDLTGFENLAFRLLDDPDHPFERLRSAFQRDKDASNLGLYLLRSRDPGAVVWSLDLARVYETDLTPFLQAALQETPELRGIDPGDWEGVPAHEKEQARRRFFCWRVLGSAGRIYGRCDRIFQSLRAEGPQDAWIVLDARSVPDPGSAASESPILDPALSADAGSAGGMKADPGPGGATDSTSAEAAASNEMVGVSRTSGFIAVARISGSLGPAEQRGDRLLRLLRRPEGERS